MGVPCLLSLNFLSTSCVTKLFQSVMGIHRLYGSMIREFFQSVINILLLNGSIIREHFQYFDCTAVRLNSSLSSALPVTQPLPTQVYELFLGQKRILKRGARQHLLGLLATWCKMPRFVQSWLMGVPELCTRTCNAAAFTRQSPEASGLSFFLHLPPRFWGTCNLLPLCSHRVHRRCAV
jgi:hypothetical protein